MTVAFFLLQATNISDNFSPENEKALIKFNFNGKKYSKELEVHGDWVDPSILNLVKQVVRDNNLNGQFYELYTGGQDASVIFLTAEQEKYLRINNLIVFADQGQNQEDEY